MKPWLHLILLLAMVAIPWSARAGVKGDLNDDGVVDVADGLLLILVVRGDVDPQTLDPEDVADVAPIIDGIGGDGEIGVADVLMMLRALEEDVDTDGLATAAENAIGTSPFLADTDGDGHLDPADPDPLLPNPPFVPGELRIFDGTDEVMLTWATPSGDVDHYIIHRYGNDGAYAYFTADATAESFVDSTATPGTVHFYWIQAVSSRGQEAEFVQCGIDPVNTAGWITGGLGPLPNPWFSVSVVGDTATLSWEESPVPAVSGYRIWSSTTAVPLGSTNGLSLADTVNSPTTTSHELTNLTPGTHYFRITAFSSSAEGNLASARQVGVVVN